MAASFPIREPTDFENELPPTQSSGELTQSGVWWVWKFGGSSVATYERMLQVVDLICDQLQQWETEPSCEAERSLPFLASSPSPPVSRQTSITPMAYDLMTVAQDHLAVISSAMGGVTDLLAAAIGRAVSVRNRGCCADGPGELCNVTSKSSRSLSDENLERSNSRSTLDTSRLSFLLEAKAELRRWGEDQAVGVQLENCSFSHIFGPPLLKLVSIHLGVVECVKAHHEGGDSAGSASARYKKRLPELEAFQRTFVSDLIDIICILQTVALTGDVADPLASLVLGQGEVWAVHLLYIILSRALNSHFQNVAPLKLNARDVLSLRRTAKPSDDLRPQLMARKCSPGRQSGASIKTATDGESFMAPPASEGLSYNPSRRSLLLEQAAVKRGSVSGGLDDSDFDDHTEEYAIGPPQQGDGACSLSRAVSLEEQYASWAFPAWKTLAPKLYPPAGPVSVMRNDTNNGGLPVIDWQVSYKETAKWFRAQEAKLAQKRRNHSGTRRGSGSVGSLLRPVKSKRAATRYVLLVTGFICKTLDGLPATLQRNGSDTSAVAFASLLRAQGVTVWSDVAGVYTGDPRHIAESEPLDYLSYEEALELAGIGAKVLHPASLLPCMHMQMPMLLKSTFKPQQKGTLIADFSHLRDDATLGKIVTKVSDVALLTLSNYPLTSVYRFASRFFETVEKGGGKILLISQGASSSAISVAVHASEVDGVLCAVQEEFRHDVQDFGSHLKVTVDPLCAVLSVVGRGQTGYVGALAAWCNALKEHNISIKAISQSSNELSTSFVVCKSQELAGLAALHSVVISVTKKPVA